MDSIRPGPFVYGVLVAGFLRPNRTPDELITGGVEIKYDMISVLNGVLRNIPRKRTVL